MTTELATRLRAELLAACPHKAVRGFLSHFGCVHFVTFRFIRPEVAFVIKFQVPCGYISGCCCNSRKTITDALTRVVFALFIAVFQKCVSALDTYAQC